MKFKVPFVNPGKNYQLIKAEIDAAFTDLMSRGDLILRGDLHDFEEKLADFVGTRFAVGVSSGYHALHLSLIASGIKPGDEVIVPAHTFVATASAVVHAGASPILVDVRSDFNIDPAKIEEAITPRTRAMIPVHLNGRLSEMETIMAIAQKHDLIVIEDACQALGGSFREKKAGAFGRTGCWSFYPFKMLGCYGDGGAITTDDPEIANMVRLLRYNGEERATGEYHYHGFSTLLDNLQAAFLNVKIRHLPRWIERRRQIAGQYRQGLGGVGDLALPHFDDPRFFDVFQNYAICTQQRDPLVRFLREEGVETLVQWPIPYYRHPGLHLIDRGFPETEAISAHSLLLPMNVELEDADVAFVVASIRKFFQT